MAKIATFEAMEVWRQAGGLVKYIYDLTAKDAFAKHFALRDQIRRASISVMSNIAQGFERSSNKEFSHSLGVSKASAAEVRSQLCIAFDLNCLDASTLQTLKERPMSVSRQLSAFTEYFRENSRKQIWYSNFKPQSIIPREEVI